MVLSKDREVEELPSLLNILTTQLQVRPCLCLSRVYNACLSSRSRFNIFAQDSAFLHQNDQITPPSENFWDERRLKYAQTAIHNVTPTAVRI